MDKKQVAIVGAGVSGLLACKYCLSKGFDPIVFDTEPDVGGVWANNTIRTTRLQTPKALYQFSDFRWPASVTDDFPTHQQILDYIRSYATQFDLICHIRFGSRVKGIGYDGPSSETWLLWNGTGEPFPPEGKWNVTVENTQTATTQGPFFYSSGAQNNKKILRDSHGASIIMSTMRASNRTMNIS